MNRNMRLLKSLVRSEVKKLQQCIHGGEVWEIFRKYRKDPKKILDFSANINPLGCTPKVIKTIKENLWQIPLYPDNSGLELKNAIANYEEQINPNNIILGNGSIELIHLFARTFIKNGDKAIVPIPTFEEYAYAVKKANGKVVRIKAWFKYKFTLKKVLSKIDSKTKAIFLCNPNNPTGNLIDKGEIIEILEETNKKSILLFVDEDFMDFVDEEERFSLVKMVKEYRNLFVLKSFTKTFGLAGLRLGYGVANEEMIDLLSMVKIPWNINSIAYIAGIAALKDLAFLKKARKIIKKERNFLINEFKKLKKIEVFPTNANFILLNIKNVGFKSYEIKERLLKDYNILIRDCSSFKGLNE
ncbi:MAG: histidinol-phosphate transaminase, partial [Candidatus Bathyarchaeia archaeon]